MPSLWSIMTRALLALSYAVLRVVRSDRPLVLLCHRMHPYPIGGIRRPCRECLAPPVGNTGSSSPTMFEESWTVIADYGSRCT